MIPARIARLGILVGIAALGASCSDDGTPAVRDGDRKASVSMTGGGPTQRRVLRTFLDRIEPKDIAEIRFVTPSGAISHRDRPGYVLMIVHADPPLRAVRGAWNAGLAVGAYNDVVSTAARPLGIGVKYRHRDGRVDDGGTIRVFGRSRYPRTGGANEGEVERRVRNAARQAQVEILDLDSGTVLRPTVAETIRTTNPRRFVADRASLLYRLRANLIRDDDPELDGFYLEVRDPEGRLVSAHAYLVRLSTGYGWTAPRYER